MEPQLAVALADGLQHNAHAVAEVVAHHAPHEKEGKEDADGRENQVEVVNISHRKRLAQQSGGEVQQVLDDDGRGSAQHTDYYAEYQHQRLILEVPLEEPPAAGDDI